MLEISTMEVPMIDSSVAATPQEALEQAKKAAGGQGALAKELGISTQAIGQWSVVPAERVLDVERITKVRRELLRPDIYPTEQSPPLVPGE
jgi:DNA-binding transcriptional regulator YdaS (Cro superfamily)